MNRVHIVGRKNHGKTQLIVELIEEFARRGLRVGSVKHSPHAHELDQPGKDSHRHRLAGAHPAAVVTSDLIGLFQRREGTDFYRQLAPMFGDCKLVLIEGDINGPGIKLEVWRQAVGERCLAHERSGISAVISDDQPGVAIPVWPRHNIQDVANRVIALADGSPMLVG